MPENITMNRARELFSSASKILVLSHYRPDGDCVGCAAALVLAARKLGKKAFAADSDQIPQKLKFIIGGVSEPVYAIAGEESDDAADAVSAFAPDLIISADVAEPQLFGRYEEIFKDRVNLKIDHHPPRSQFAEYNYADDTTSSCSEIIYRMLEPLGVIDPDIASALYAGIISDTCNFKYPDVTSETHRAAAALIDLGVDHSKINEKLFGKRSRSEIEALRLALDTLEFFTSFTEKAGAVSCAMVTMTNEDKRDYGIDEDDLGELHSFPRDIEGVDVGVVIRQIGGEKNLYKISLRSDRTDVSKICEHIDGGGHTRASGGRISAQSLDDAVKQVMAAISAYAEPIIE